MYHSVRRGTVGRIGILSMLITSNLLCNKHQMQCLRAGRTPLLVCPVAARRRDKAGPCWNRKPTSLSLHCLSAHRPLKTASRSKSFAFPPLKAPQKSAHIHKTLNAKDFAFMAHNIHNIFGFDCKRIKGSYDQRTVGHTHTSQHTRVSTRHTRSKRFCIWSFQMQNVLDFKSLDQYLTSLIKSFAFQRCWLAHWSRRMHIRSKIF
jgi:hypothetical protein